VITRLPPKRGGRRSYSKFSVLNPGKGLNNFISDNLINDQEASDLENVQFTEAGSVTKADGYTSVGTGLTNAPRGLGYYIDTSNNKYLLTVDGTGLVYLNGSTWTGISGATFSSTAQINMTQARGIMYIWDATNGGAQLSGSTLTRPGTMPRASFSIFYSGYHVCAGVDTQPSRVYISVLTDASDFTNDPSVADPTPDNSTDVPGASVFSGTGTGSAIAQFIDVSKNDGDKITGLAKFQEVLVIFKERSIYQLTMDATGVPTVQLVTKNYGCVSHRSIDNVENDVFFLSRNGIYVLGNEPNFFNVIRTNELSARIHPIIETINELKYDKSTALFSGYTYMLAMPTGSSTTNNTVITYDRRYQGFSRWTHVLPEAFCIYTDSNNEDAVYFTSTTTAKVYKMTPGTYSANGSAISAQWTSKAFDLQDFASYKRWIDVTIMFRQLSGVITIEVLTDNGTIVKTATVSGLSARGIGTDTWGSSLWGGDVESSTSSTASATNNVPYRLKISTKARTVKIRISNERINESFNVLGMSFTYRPMSHFTWPSTLRIQ
jgi:hypothetical protein